jgi:hypothetical protein
MPPPPMVPTPRPLRSSMLVLRRPPSHFMDRVYAKSEPHRPEMNDTHVVMCPYCGEEIEIYVEPDVRGSYVQDCEVCCNPWMVRVHREDDEVYVEVGRADGSE